MKIGPGFRSGFRSFFSDNSGGIDRIGGYPSRPGTAEIFPDSTNVKRRAPEEKYCFSEILT